MKMRQRKVKAFRHVPSWRVSACGRYVRGQSTITSDPLMHRIASYWRNLRLSK